MAADAVAVSRGSFLRSLGRRRFHVRLLVIAAVGAVGGAIFDWLVGRPIMMHDIIVGAVWALGWIGLLLVLLYLLIPRRSRRMFRQQRSLDREFTFTWTDTGIVFDSENSRSELLWEEYHDWFETSAVFGFGLNERLYHWVPVRTLDPAQIADLRETAERSLSL